MKITIKTNVEASIEDVWAAWTEPEHIMRWNFASEDWHCPSANNTLTVGKKFVYRMEAKDGSIGFDFGGTFTKVEPRAEIEYVLDDDRRVTVKFVVTGQSVTVIETFEAENELSGEQQRLGWQSILNNFKFYVEASGN